MINNKIIELIAGAKESWSVAGDQLFVNLDYSKQNLPIGQKNCLGSNCEVILKSVKYIIQALLNFQHDMKKIH